MTGVYNNGSPFGQFKYTLIQSTGKPISKPLVEGPDGWLASIQPEANLSEGYFWTMTADSIDDYANQTIDRHGNPNFIVLLGHHATLESGHITFSGSGLETDTCLARGEAAFGWRAGETTAIVLDCDVGSDENKPDALDCALIECVPYLAPVARFWKPSARSHVAHGVRWVNRKSKWHCTLVISDAAMAKAIGEDIFIRTYENGHGFAQLGNGPKRYDINDYSMIDKTIFQGSRELFEFGGIIAPGSGLTQLHAHYAAVFADVPLLDVTTLPELKTIAAWKVWSKKRKANRAKLGPEQARLNGVFAKVEVPRLKGLGMSEVDAVRAVADYQNNDGKVTILHHLFELELSSGRKFLAGDVYTDATFHSVRGIPCRDPMEPDYGKTAAILYAGYGQTSKQPVIHSLAHGNTRTYMLMMSPTVPLGLQPNLMVPANERIPAPPPGGDQIPAGGFPFKDAVPQAAPPPPPPAYDLPPAPPQTPRTYDLPPPPREVAEPQASAVVLPFKSIHGLPPAPPGTAAPVPRQGGAATALAVAFEPTVYVEPDILLDPGRNRLELLEEIPDSIRKQLDNANPKGGLKWVIQQLMRRKLTPGEVYALLHEAKAGEAPLFDHSLKTVITTAAVEYLRRVKQQKDDIEIGNDRSAPTVPFVTLKEMQANFVWVADGRYLFDRVTGRMLPFGDAMSFFVASKTPVKTDKTDDVGKPVMKEVSTLQLWHDGADRHTVDVPTWAPGRPTFIPAPEGVGQAINIWTGLRPYVIPQDWERLVALWDAHLEYLIPIAAERKRFLQWLAHIVQKPGELPHTYYMHIATMTGVGRSWLGSVLTRVFRGYVANGVDLNRVLKGDFNGQLSKKLLIVVEEAHEGMEGLDRRERATKLKSIITEAERRINPKYGREYTETNAARWLMFSNHEDPLPIDDADRRAEFIENPKEAKSEAYYTGLYGALSTPTFIAAVRHRLETFDLTGFNAGSRAGMNASKQKALELSTSDVELTVKQFKLDWPGHFAMRRTVAEYVRDAGCSNVTPKHLQYAIQRAKFETVGKTYRINNRSERVVVIRGITPNDLSTLNSDFVGAWSLYWEMWMKLHGGATDECKLANPPQMPVTTSSMPVAAVLPVWLST